MILHNLENWIRVISHSQQPDLIFMHIPKTGRTSVDRGFKNIYGKYNSHTVDPILTSKAVKVLHSKEDTRAECDKFQVRESILLCEMARGTKYISGHFRFNKTIWEAYRHQYCWITVLRDPVKRYISQYFFDAHKPGEHHARVNESLEEFIQSDRGKFRGQNYINYFGNFSRGDEIDFSERLEVAKENMSNFLAIGFLDDLDSLKSHLKQKLQVSLNIPHINKNPVAYPQIQDSVKERIEEICKYDSLLYAHAKKLYSTGN